MKLNSVFHQLAHGCGVCLPLLLIAGLLVPGCAGKRSDLLSSLIKPKASVTDDESDPSAEESSADSKSALIAGAVDEDNSSQVSAYSAEEIIEGPSRLRNRFRSIFGRSVDAAAADPFLEESAAEIVSEETAVPRKRSVAKDGNSKMDELLASFQTKPARQQLSEVRPWWESGETTPQPTPAATATATTAKSARAVFSPEFDSRLERLRAELALSDDAIARDRHVATSTEAQSSLTQSAQPVVRGAVATKQQSHPAMIIEPKNLQGASTMQHQQLPGDAKARVKSLMAEAHREWENWNLETAHQMAVRAQQLTERENVPFLTQEERPEELARLIAADLHKDQQLANAEPAPRSAFTPTSNPFADEEPLGIESAASQFGFDELDRLANPWKAKSAAKVATLQTSEPPDEIVPESLKIASEPPAGASGGGVSLLPPDDDFPSDANSSGWQQRFTAGQSTAGQAEDIQLATHKFPEFSAGQDERVRSQMNGLSVEDNRALLKSVAEQKNRVFEPKSVQWPTLPTTRELASHNQTPGDPIRIAKAPRLALNDDQSLSSTAAVADSKLVSTGKVSLLGQVWRSQPIWFIGGLILLIVALRLIPWPKQESP